MVASLCAMSEDDLAWQCELLRGSLHMTAEKGIRVPAGQL